MRFVADIALTRAPICFRTKCSLLIWTPERENEFITMHICFLFFLVNHKQAILMTLIITSLLPLMKRG
jgi:hypothetical protein